MTIYLFTLIIISHIFIAVMYWDMRRMEEDIDIIYDFIEDLYKKELNRVLMRSEEKYAEDNEDD